MSNPIAPKIDDVATNVVAKHAALVDRDGAFPEASVAALAAAGALGILSAKDAGGAGLGPRAAAGAVERVARECGSTAMVLCMHLAGTAVLEALAPLETRKDAAAGKHLSTLAFSEVGSRSHFWAPVGTATSRGSDIALNAKKSFVTSANRATAYVWSSKPLAKEGPSTIWLVPSKASGVRVASKFDGLGLRGNDSAPVTAEGAVVHDSAMLGEDGKGLAVMLEIVLPLFNVMSAGFSVGLMEAATQSAIAHVKGGRLEHAGSALADLPTVRAYLSRMRIKTDLARALLDDTLSAMESGRPDTMLRVLECKAAAGEMATEVTDLAMRVCGGVAFRKGSGVERIFRDARASTVMSPTTDLLYEFIGRAVCGMEVFG
jgi:alkylation response protein AidB-like acyl-CoA dehydrogenase